MKKLYGDKLTLPSYSNNGYSMKFLLSHERHSLAKIMSASKTPLQNTGHFLLKPLQQSVEDNISKGCLAMMQLAPGKIATELKYYMQEK